MNFPTLKNPLLCRIMVYVAVIGAFAVPGVIIAMLSFIPLAYKIIGIVILSVALLVFILKNFVVLMILDVKLAKLKNQALARKRFVLPSSFSAEKVEAAISKFGRQYEPLSKSPMPSVLSYKSNAPLNIYSSGIERVIAIYKTDTLDEEGYRSIIKSAMENSKLLEGEKKHILLGKEQKEASLNRVTVVIIFASKTDSSFKEVLYKAVCSEEGDGYDIATLPCVVDLEGQYATFDSEKIPYVGSQYPVKNRGINLIKKYLFNNELTYSESHETVDDHESIDREQSLWSFWKKTKEEIKDSHEDVARTFETMSHGEILLDDGFIYVKWEDKGILLAAEINEEAKEAEIDAIEIWNHPKISDIEDEEIKKSIANIIVSYFSELGYKASFIACD